MAAKTHEKLQLEATTRTITGSKVATLRRDGVLPAVVYGKGFDAINIQVPVKTFEKVFKQAGESTLVYLIVGTDTYPTIIHDVTRDPLSGDYQHADFYKVRLDEKVKTDVPVVFVGESPAVKEFKAIFVRNVNELEVEAFPADLPQKIEVDVSGLKAFGDQITLADITTHGWVFTADATDVIATVQEPKSEEELAAELAEPTTDVSAVEEIKKEEKAEEVAEEGEAAPAAAPAPAEAKKE
ncbi:MAG TPA: 50S ribosomal protein L25 [Candidatus Paceibacterota bacterium]|nr:50S ribosomal protein L25 [Candidatus Paceibacterota bacterium]